MSKATGLPYPGFPPGYPGFPLTGGGLPPLLPPPAIMSLAMANHLGRRSDIMMSRCPTRLNDVTRVADSYSPGLAVLLRNQLRDLGNKYCNNNSKLVAEETL